MTALRMVTPICNLQNTKYTMNIIFLPLPPLFSGNGGGGKLGTIPIGGGAGPPAFLIWGGTYLVPWLPCPVKEKHSAGFKT